MIRPDSSSGRGGIGLMNTRTGGGLTAEMPTAWEGRPPGGGADAKIFCLPMGLPGKRRGHHRRRTH